MKAPGAPDFCSGAGKKPNMVTEADVIAFIKMVIELFVKERNALKTAGLEVDTMLATMRNLLDQAAATEQQQEAMKRQTKLTTESWLALKRTAYVTTSGYLDMAMAAVRKDSILAKNFRRIRSRMYRPNRDEKIEAESVKA